MIRYKKAVKFNKHNIYFFSFYLNKKFTKLNYIDKHNSCLVFLFNFSRVLFSCRLTLR